MGLDLYVGTLARYHTGEWEPEAVSVGREAGLAVVHYAQRPKRLSKISASIVVGFWRWRMQRKFVHLISQKLQWPETLSAPYLVRKPDHDGQRALVLAAAYAEHPELTPPKELPLTNDVDPAYAAASQNYSQSAISILECHMFLPSSDSFLIAAPDAVGNNRFITSTANLKWALELVNSAHWRADEPTIRQWDHRGAVTRWLVTFEAGNVAREEIVPPPVNPFQHCAQFGFAIYSRALEFSHMHQLPIVTDE